jgi:hypothetical protein
MRTYFEYRELGIVNATKGKVLPHVIRAKEPCSGPGGYHNRDVEFQMSYVLRGWTRVEFDDVGDFRFEASDSWLQEPGVKREVLEYPNDWEAIEICMPAEIPTANAEC